MLVGYVASNLELKVLGDGRKVCNMLLRVRRDFKDMNGEYIYDLIRVTMWEFLAEMACETLKKGSRVGLKGRITPKTETLENGYQTIVHTLTADRIIYFDERSKDEDEEESLSNLDDDNTLEANEE